MLEKPKMAAFVRLSPRPNRPPLALAAPNAALVRSEINRRSCSATLARMCKRSGGTSEPRSATRNGTRCTIKFATKATSRDKRSNLATTTGVPLPRWRASASAADQQGAVRERRLLDRHHCLSGHPGKSGDFSFHGERLGGEAPMLEGVPVASRSAAASSVHPADLDPAPPELGTAARSASIWRGIATPGA
jgi:hypothetical protein